MSVFQGLTLCGAGVFKPDVLNRILNVVVERLDKSAGEDRLNFDQVITAFELLHTYRKLLAASSDSKHGSEQGESLIDTEALMSFANDKYFKEFLTETKNVTTHQLSCMYWMYHALGGHWDTEIVRLMEDTLITNVTREILVQRDLEKENDEKTDLALQTMRMSDLNTIVQLYGLDTALRDEASTRYKEISRLVK